MLAFVVAILCRTHLALWMGDAGHPSHTAARVRQIRVWCFGLSLGFSQLQNVVRLFDIGFSVSSTQYAFVSVAVLPPTTVLRRYCRSEQSGVSVAPPDTSAGCRSFSVQREVHSCARHRRIPGAFHLLKYGLWRAPSLHGPLFVRLPNQEREWRYFTARRLHVVLNLSGHGCRTCFLGGDTRQSQDLHFSTGALLQGTRTTRTPNEASTVRVFGKMHLEPWLLPQVGGLALSVVNFREAWRSITNCPRGFVSQGVPVR